MSAPWSTWRGAALVGAALVPGILTLGLAFRTGGFYPGATAVGTLVLTALLIGRVLLADQPFAGFNTWLAITIGAMALFAVWVLASTSWSDSSARAMTEFDRSLLYLMALIFFGSIPRTARYARWLLLGVAAAMVIISVAGFVTRTMPDVWAAPPERVAERWGYPIGYWNALGMAAALALVFCLHLTCSAREPKGVRLIAVMAMPVAASTMLFTFSRGPLAVAAVGLVVYLVLARPRLAPTGLIAAVPTTAVAVLVSYHADFAARSGRGMLFKPLSGADLTEAHEVALTVGGCALVALLLRALGMLVLDPALERLQLRRRTKRTLALAAGALVAAVVAVAVVVSLQNDRLQTQYDRLINDPVTQTGDQRDRLFNPGLNRVQRWDVALDAFSADPITGNGAGTYRLAWERNRPNDENTNDAHSLYLETLGELGLVGAVLLALVLLSALAALAWRMRAKGGRSVYAALLTGALMWAVHAATDWDWELPVLTLWVFAAAGLALASEQRPVPPGRLGWPVRIAVVVALVLLAITPARLAVSEARLGQSLRDYRADNCAAAVAEAEDSLSVLGNLPEPYQVKGYCQARGGDAAGAVASLRRAVNRDPGNWRYHYGLALAQGLEGVDPRPEAREARRLNPRDPLARQAVRAFRTSRSAQWRRAARTLGLGIPSGQR